MPGSQQFMTADGMPVPSLRITDAGDLIVPPDTFSAQRFLLAVLETDTATMLEILQERPALELLAGLSTLTVAFGQGLYGEKLPVVLDGLALFSTEPAADAFRERRAAE
jgi:hypothetical protein